MQQFAVSSPYVSCALSHGSFIRMVSVATNPHDDRDMLETYLRPLLFGLSTIHASFLVMLQRPRGSSPGIGLGCI